MFRQLPAHPDIRHLKRQARILLRDVRSGAPGAVERVKAAGLHEARALADALHVVAREYGFESWPKLTQQLSAHSGEASDPVSLARKAFHEDDARALRRLLQENAVLRSAINEPVADFDSPPITQARSRAMLDVLLDFGADINAKSRWWAGGFGLLDCADPALAEYAIRRGAHVGPHAAARLGMIDRLAALVADDAGVVHARGGDGQTPLHFASTVEVARLLLDHGADMDARDIDHESTPAQYMVKSRPTVARFLVSRGCATDILMAAALGDPALARAHLDADPQRIRIRVSDEYFPMVGKRAGGTIYQWELGWYVSACQVARAFGHSEVVAFLRSRCPPEELVLDACWEGRARTAAALGAGDAGASFAWSPPARRHVAHAARNNNLKAVRLMLAAGLPADARSQHGGSALHWAAFHGNAAMVRLLLTHRQELEDSANDFTSTPLGWAIHGSEKGWYAKTGDYAAVVEVLLLAGALPPEKPQGSDAVRRVLTKDRGTG